MLQPQGMLLNAQLYEQQQQQHNLLKQHIRQTVLTRAGSKSQVVEHVEEETEAAVAQEMKDQPEVIDLTDSRKGSTSSASSSTAASEPQPPPPTSAALLQLQQRHRDLINRHSLHLGAGAEGEQGTASPLLPALSAQRFGAHHCSLTAALASLLSEQPEN